MRIFCEVSGLLDLECAGLWEDARKLLYCNWIKQKDDIECLCRVISECWLVLSEWHFLNHGINGEYFRFKETLIDATQYGLSQFNDNPKFLWLTGYMIQMFPNYFCSKEKDVDFVKWEQQGKSMLFRATQLEPSNLIAQTLYWGTKSISPVYSDFKALLEPQLSALFPGQTAIEKYFIEILKRHTGDGSVC